jgi:hypothetical protein
MEFIRCPKCGEFDERRTQCRCGYSAADTPAAPARPADTEQPRVSKGGGTFGCGGCLLLLVGIGVFVWGAQEYWVSRGATEQPEDMDLAKIEAGERPSQNHIRLGKHLRLYPSLIFATAKSQKDSKDPPIHYSFYPLISPSHPQLAKERIEDIAAAGDDPHLKEFTVLVRTEQFKRVGEVPHGPVVENSIQGMVINSISSLSADEAKLIKDSFPNLDTNRLLILEQDRTPASLFKSFGIMAGGAVLVLIVLASLLRGQKAASPAE